MKWFSSRAPATLSPSHQRCDRGGSSAPRRGEPHRERQPDAFCLGLAQHGQIREHDRQQRAEHHEVQPGAAPDRRNVECTADTGHAAEPDGTHHRREVRPRPVLERPVLGDALPIAFLHQRVAVEPPEPRDREHADDRKRDKHRGNQRTHSGPPVHRRDQHRHRRQRHQCEAVVQEDAPAEQEPGSPQRPPPAAAPCAERPTPTTRYPTRPRLRNSRRRTPRPRWPSAPPRRTAPPAGPCSRPPRRAPPRTIAAAALDPTSRHSSPAHAPPPSPMRSSQTNVSSAPGGWPDTCVIHEFGWKSGILLANVRTASGMSVMVGTWRRYSCCAVRRAAKPRCQPSIIASENAHAHAVAQVTHGSARHGRRNATACPHSTAATPMTIAGTVPQPTWAFHHPKIGAVSAKLWSRALRRGSAA